MFIKEGSEEEDEASGVLGMAGGQAYLRNRKSVMVLNALYLAVCDNHFDTQKKINYNLNGGEETLVI